MVLAIRATIGSSEDEIFTLLYYDQKMGNLQNTFTLHT